MMFTLPSAEILNSLIPIDYKAGRSLSNGGGGGGVRLLFGTGCVLDLNFGVRSSSLGSQEGTPYSNIHDALPTIFSSQINQDSIFLGLKSLIFHFHTFSLKLYYKYKGLCFIFEINDNNREKSDLFPMKSIC